MSDQEIINGLTENRHDKITSEEYNELFKPFYDAQPQSQRELQIYRDMVDDFEPNQLGLVTPDLISDYAKYEALRRVYADKFDGVIQPENGEPTDPMYRTWKIYERLSETLMNLIRLQLGRWE